MGRRRSSPPNPCGNLRWSLRRAILSGFPAGTSAGAAHDPVPRLPRRGAQLQDGTLRMLDQLQPTTDHQITAPTALRVRQDLYDEDYSDADYEQMLSMYEGTMAQIVEGEIVKS